MVRGGALIPERESAGYLGINRNRKYIPKTFGAIGGKPVKLANGMTIHGDERRHHQDRHEGAKGVPKREWIVCPSGCNVHPDSKQVRKLNLRQICPMGAEKRNRR